MNVHRPPQVFPARLGDDLGGVRAVHRDVVLEAVVADVLHEVLKARDVGDGAMAEGFELVIGGRPLPDVAADDAGGVVGGEAGIGERPGGGATLPSAARGLPPHRGSREPGACGLWIRRGTPWPGARGGKGALVVPPRVGF